MCRIVRCLAAVALALVLAEPSPGHPHPKGEEGGGLSSEEAGEEPSESFALFPRSHVFEPLLADMKEPVFSAAFRRARFKSGAVPARSNRHRNVGLVALGETMELARWTDREHDRALGFGAFAGVFSQFDMDASSDLINSDFLVGLPVTLRQGFLSTRLRLYHQSSHLGDEFLLSNPDVGRDDLSFEAVDGLLAAEGSGWRLYGGGGYILRTSTGLDRGLAQWGVELRGSELPTASFANSRVAPVFGADFKSLEEQDWEVTSSLKGGLEWKAKESTRTVRLLLVYLNGFVPFGQFFDTERVDNYGVELQFSL